MLQKVEITDAGDSELIAGEQVDRMEMDEINDRLVAERRKPAAGMPVLLGITKASLQTRSFITRRRRSRETTTASSPRRRSTARRTIFEGLKGERHRRVADPTRRAPVR